MTGRRKKTFKCHFLFFQIRIVYLRKHLIKGLKGILSLAVSLISNPLHFSELYFLQQQKKGYWTVSVFPKGQKELPVVSLEVIIGGVLNSRVTAILFQLYHPKAKIVSVMLVLELLGVTSLLFLLFIQTQTLNSEVFGICVWLPSL